MIAALRSRLPPSLTGRLVIAVVALVAVAGLLVTLTTTLVLHQYLAHELDDRVSFLADRAVDVRHEGSGPRGSGGPGDHREGSTSEAPGPGEGEWVLDARLDAGAARITISSGPYVQREVSPTAARLERLSDVPVDGAPTSLDLGSDAEGDLGTYRVVARSAPDGSGVLVAGQRVDGINRTVSRMLLAQLLLTAGAVAIAGAAGLVVVRRTLRPLRDVAHTAHEVTALPLDTGEVGETARVPERLTDPRTEVGQVGAALNRLLGHVEGALDARHRSEQQVRQFVADASHELRTPLATIMGYAELARRSPSYGPGDALLKVEEEGVRMRALVEDLLLLARLDAGRPLAQEQVDLTKLALESVEDARVVGGDHQWLLDLPEEPVTVTGDDQRLHQVLANLLTNARRHTPSGTTVRVGLSTSAGEDGRRAVLTVADNGPGIPSELLPLVFERFTRADTSRTRDSGGAGLGLALVQAIVSAHHGSVSVDSSPGSTVFCVSLPLD